MGQLTDKYGFLPGTKEFILAEENIFLASRLEAETAALKRAAECRALNGSGDADYWLEYYRSGLHKCDK